MKNWFVLSGGPANAPTAGAPPSNNVVSGMRKKGYGGQQSGRVALENALGLGSERQQGVGEGVQHF